MWQSFVLEVMFITLLLPKIVSKKISINHGRLNKYNFALYLLGDLCIPLCIAYCMARVLLMSGERSEIDIFSNYFEILKGELAGGVYFFYLLAILMLNSLMFWGKALTVTI